MQWFLVITIVAALSNFIEAHPHHNVEIEKLRLVKFPEESFNYQTRQQTDETRRILEEINKINVALGYVKKQPEHRGPSVLDSNTYLYPQSSYHPLHNNYGNGASVSPSIRILEHAQPFVSRKITHQHSLMIPQMIDASTYYYPASYLKLPLIQEPTNFRNSQENLEGDSSELSQEKLMAISNDVTSIVEYGSNSNGNNEVNRNHNVREGEFSRRLLSDLRRIIAEEVQIKRSKSKIETLRKNEDVKKILPEFILLPAKHLSNTREQFNNNHTLNKPFKSDKKSPDIKIKNLPNRPILRHPLPAERAPIGLLRPRPSTTVPTTMKPTTMKTTKMPMKKIESSESEEDGEQGTEKYLGLSGVNREAIKQGGIIIQRLKVRKGGIAIAGPGGVATAGSGGTAIVGPGGLAFTHPKSLTIAGPGARVIAFPESFDLEKAILNSSSKWVPEEGRLVATGPAIYYHPADGISSESEISSDSEHSLSNYSKD